MKLTCLCLAAWILVPLCSAQVAPGQSTTTSQATQSPLPPPYRILVPKLTGATGVYSAENFINPVTSNNPPYPQLQPWLFRNTVTRRFNYNDFLFGASVELDYQHGGSNFMGVDTELKPKAVNGNFENVTALTLNLNSNTDVQDGGTLGISTNHYGHGDSVMFTATTNATGGSRGTDEDNRVFRVFSQFHGNNYGILIASLRKDAFGQAVLTATKSADGIPLASPAHDLHASMENGPLLNTNPAKVYTAGNVADVEICPDTPSSARFYMCVKGDAATRWSERYGASAVTTLTADLSDMTAANAVLSKDRFAAGPVCTDIFVASTAGFKVGELFTISSPGDNFEQPALLGVGQGSLHACFGRPHAAGELVSSGGAVGHALSFANDDMAPRTVPGNANENDSTLRLGYPIVASLPGNLLMVWVNPAGNGGQPELKSRGFAANLPMLPASFTPVLDPHTHGIASWTVQSGGNYGTRSKTHEGADLLPPPAISFVGSVCKVLPVAHTTYAEEGGGQVKPVTDQPGDCTSLKVSVQQEYPNPASIYPMLWARSNRDPDFVPSPHLNDLGINASTDGYMVAGGLSPEFAVGDPVEFGYWWQQYITSEIMMSSWMGKSRSFGSYFNLEFNGMYGQSLLHVRNITNPADYYGTPETGFSPGLHGEGRMAPPIGYQISGPVQYGMLMQMPRPRAGTTQDSGGLRFECGFGPCRHGDWNHYDWINAEAKDGDQAGLRFDPSAHTLTFYDYQNGLFLAPAGIGTRSMKAMGADGTVSIDAVAPNDGKGGLKAGSIQLIGGTEMPCDAGHRFTQTPMPGGPGVADSYRVCLKDAADQYAWHTLGILK